MTDVNSCRATATSTITEPTVISLTSAVAAIACNGDKGGIDITASGGTAPYTYNWNSGFSTNEDLTGLDPGTYAVTVTDDNGCTESLSETLTEPAVLSLTETHVDVLCNGDATGSIDLSVTGGTTPYAYAWDNSAASITQDISNLVADSYAVIVTDDNGCTENISIDITEPTALSLSATQTNISCNGDSDGSINLTVSGGSAPYTYSWDDPASSTTQDISSLPAGTYEVTVTDDNSCTETLSVTLTEPAVLALSTSQTNVGCNGASTGAIDLTVAGGTAPFTYSWDDASSSTTQDISNLPVGTYTVTVTDANGCSETTSATLTEPTALSITSTAYDVSCNSGNDGSIDIVVNGGTSPLAYSWNDPSSSTVEDISGLTAGSYTVTVTDGNGCTETESVTIAEPTALSLTESHVNLLCNGASTGSIDLKAYLEEPRHILIYGTMQVLLRRKI